MKYTIVIFVSAHNSYSTRPYLFVQSPFLECGYLINTYLTDNFLAGYQKNFHKNHLFIYLIQYL